MVSVSRLSDLCWCGAIFPDSVQFSQADGKVNLSAYTSASHKYKPLVLVSTGPLIRKVVGI